MITHCGALAPLLLALTTACALVTGPDQRGLVVRADPPHLVLTNEGERPVFYFAIEGGLAALANWAPCSEPTSCARVDGGTEVRLAYESVAGYSAEAEVILVYWWHLIAKSGGGFQPDSIRVAGAHL